MSAGRTLAAIPRSTIQTSPRLGMGILLIKQDKCLVREDREFVVRQRAVTGQWSEAENLVADPGLLGRFELPELVHQFCGYRSHAEKLIPTRPSAKRILASHACGRSVRPAGGGERGPGP